MWVELTTGKDSFRAQDASPRRNVGVQAFVRVATDGDGRKVIPLYQAFTNKLPGFGKQSLISRISATQMFDHGDCGEWFKTRFEVTPGTEIMIEYRHLGLTGFSAKIEYLLLVAKDTAPLWQIRLDLPMHFLSSVPVVFFDGRFEIVKSDDMLPDEAAGVWRKWLGVDDEYPLAFYTDACQPEDDRFFKLIELEKRIMVKAENKVVTKSDGTTATRIVRRRNIKVR